MLPKADIAITSTHTRAPTSPTPNHSGGDEVGPPDADPEPPEPPGGAGRRRRFRQRYGGALAVNAAAFVLPALYATLSKLWVARLDAARVATTDAYTYVGTVAEVLNEGLPRAAWVVVGDAAGRPRAARLRLAHTLVAAQAALGLGLSLVLAAAADAFAAAFVPREIRAESLAYVRIAAFSAFASAVETAVAAAARALDKPDVPLVISAVRFLVNIVLDLLLLSPFHVGAAPPTVNRQAGIQLACGLGAAAAGAGYLFWTQSRPAARRSAGGFRALAPCWRALGVLARPGLLTLAESLVRNALYLWLVSTVVALGSLYATAWGVFNTIRWGLVMVPVQALEATALVFTGHAWGWWRHHGGTGEGARRRRPRATRAELLAVARPALVSLALALAFEVPAAVLLSRFGARPFARYLGGADDVAAVTAAMWRAVDWCYVFYAASTQLAALLLATRPAWYLYQSLASNLLYVLPWAAVCQAVPLRPDNAWTYHRLVFGGSLVFTFVDVLLVDALWAWTLLTGRARLEKWHGLE